MQWIQTTLHTAHSLHTVQCTLYNINCTLYTVHYTPHTAQYKTQTAHRTLHTAHCIHCTLPLPPNYGVTSIILRHPVCTSYCTLHFLHSTLYTPLLTLHIACCTLNIIFPSVYYSSHCAMIYCNYLLLYYCTNIILYYSNTVRLYYCTNALLLYCTPILLY